MSTVTRIKKEKGKIYRGSTAHADWLGPKVGGHLVLFCIHQTGWTFAMAVPWWQHHKQCHVYYYYITKNTVKNGKFCTQIR